MRRTRIKDFIYDDRCTGKFKILTKNNHFDPDFGTYFERNGLLKGKANGDFPYIILQEILDIDGDKLYINLHEAVGFKEYGDFFNVGSHSYHNIKIYYDEVIKDYKPILREKRLKQLLG